MMKQTLVICTILLFMLTAPGCRHDNSPLPSKFIGYENNPIVVPGEPGSWDEMETHTPEIVWHDSVFYLFYTSSRLGSNMAIGLATSTDGFHFTKFADNPVLAPDNKGFDAYSTGPPRIVEIDTGWLMYYNALEIAGFNPGPYIGVAQASKLTGPWLKREQPVLTSGTKGEWDDGFVIPCSFLKLEDGSFVMYYVGSKEYFRLRDFYIGMATSRDGLKWDKYNDPVTREHPYAESDPVLRKGNEKDWDGDLIWIADAISITEGFGMYYTGMKDNNNENTYCIGYATSKDGIHWERYRGNPIYAPDDDPFTRARPEIGCIENPTLLFLDSLCYLYYDYGSNQLSIGMATARVP